jgi:NAD(P)-dependent dehydrogenase (short-subunit alcohol dehydrogenase family)
LTSPGTALHQAAREGDLTKLRSLLDFGADPNQRDGSGKRPLIEAVAAGHLNAARALIENKLIAAIALAKHSLGKLRVGGSITFSSGISGDRPTPGGCLNAAAAASLGGLTRALAVELGPTRVNVVSPGWVDTPVWDTLAGEAKTGIWEQMARRLPVRRIGSAADVALAYVFLMESEFTTGTILHIDGGQALV